MNLFASDYTKILIGNGLDLLFYVTAFNDPGVLEYLETKFCEMLSDLNNMQIILVELYTEVEVFREGFTALANTPYITWGIIGVKLASYIENDE